MLRNEAENLKTGDILIAKYDHFNEQFGNKRFTKGKEYRVRVWSIDESEILTLKPDDDPMGYDCTTATCFAIDFVAALFDIVDIGTNNFDDAMAIV